MGNIASPLVTLIARLKFHRDTGYTPRGATDPVKLLAGVKIYELPTQRTDEDEDLPYLMVHVPKIEESILSGGGHRQASASVLEVQIDLSTNVKFGLYSETDVGFLNLVESFVAACTRDEQGNPDRWLKATVLNQIAIAVSDGVASDQSVTASAVIKLHSKAYQ